jgi:hypothetical protein
VLSANRLGAPLVLVSASFVLAGGCGTPETPSKFPPQKPGCEVQIFPESPSYQTENIGVVNATCDETVSDAECLRTLKDEGCRLGADTIWGVNERPEVKLGKKRLSGRAAHQK